MELPLQQKTSSILHEVVFLNDSVEETMYAKNPNLSHQRLIIILFDLPGETHHTDSFQLPSDGFDQMLDCFPGSS